MKYCVVQFTIKMPATCKNDDYFETLAKCQTKLLEINQKLLEIKKRHSKMDDLFPNKGGRKHKAKLEENYVLLKKEAELLERDIAFVSSLMESGNDANRSLTAKIMKKVLPGRMFNAFGRETSKELKANIMSHSTKFLEEKVISLESLTKRSKKKITEEKRFCHRALEKTSRNKCSGSSGSSKCRLKIYNKTSEGEQEITQNSSWENDLLVFKNDVCTDHSVFTLDEIKHQKVKRKKRKQTANVLESMEKFAQTENIDCIQRLSSIESLEKCVQTEEFQISFMNPEICMALKKVFDDCINRERVQLEGEDPNEDSLSYDLSESSKDFKPSADKCSGLTSPTALTCFQNNFTIGRFQALDSNVLTNLIQEIERNSMVSRESVVFPNPMEHSKTQERKIVKRVSYLLSQNSYLPEIRFIKECVSELSVLEYDFAHQNLSETKSLSSSNSGVSVQVIKKQSRHEPLRSTLEIQYCQNANTSGRIVLTEMGNEQCSTQTEIFGRIVTYLLGLKTSSDNT